MLKLGAKIRNIREAKKLSQEYVAAKLEMSPSGYGKIERDETELTITKAYQISEILEISINKVLDIQENSTQEIKYNKGLSVQNNQGEFYNFPKETVAILLKTKDEVINELKQQLATQEALIKELMKKLK